MLLGNAGCSSKAGKEARYLKEAGKYFEAGDYDKAEIEYINVLRIEAANPEAIGKLGTLYFEQGRLDRALPLIMGGLKLKPDDLNLRLESGMFLLALGRLKEANEAANLVLDKRPQDQDAPLLLVDIARTRGEIDLLRKRLLQLPAAAQAGAPVIVALGTIDFRERDPKAAEAAFKRALAVDPKSAAANTALASLYWSQNNLEGADKAFAAAADLSPAHSVKKLQYAEFKIKTGKSEDARKLLEATTKRTPDLLQAWVLLAQIAGAQKNYDNAEAYLAKVLARDPENAEALLAKAKYELAKGEIDKAVSIDESVAAGSTEKGEASLNHAVALAPGYAEAELLLAAVSIRKGDYGAAVATLRQLGQQHPEIIQAQTLLADAYRAQGDLDNAFVVCRQLAKELPKIPQPLMMIGTLYAQQNKREEARKAFGEALALAPDYPPALEHLVDLDLMDKDFAGALKRVNERIGRNPKLAEPQILLARVYFAQRDWGKAEVALKKAIELQPDVPAAYSMLAELYLATQRQEKALADLQDAVARNPKDTDALMLMAMIQDQQGNYAAARASYEKVLSVNPRFASALNNLAFLVSERFGELDRAFELAQKARQLLPNDPHVADTLGWILYKRHQYTWSLTLLQESASNLPADADTQFHLGMSEYMMGHEEPARVALERSLKLSPAFRGRDEAKARLAVLTSGGESQGADARSVLEKAVADSKDDPVALTHLAAFYEREGLQDKAKESYEAARVLSPSNAFILDHLAQLYATGKDADGATAMDLAKAARKAAPDDPEVAHTLGNIAFQQGQHVWAASLLQEAAGAEPNDAKLLYDLATASYSVGKVQEAEDAMKRALQAGPSLPQAKNGALFVEMIEASNPPLAAGEDAKVHEELAADPNDVPALVAKAAFLEQARDFGASTVIYELILRLDPDFLPAEKHLLSLYATNGAEDRKALDVGRRALEAFPNDPGVERDYGIVIFRSGDFARASELLASVDQAGGLDALGLYSLGISQFKLKQLPKAKLTLKRALDLGLSGDAVADAKRTLSGIK
jgi:Tfp pilus assembly protein PilF